MSDAKHRPFVSLSGVPTLRHSVTAFLDVLGFSQLCSLETDITESQRILLRIDNAIRDAVAAVEQSLSAEDEPVFRNGAAKFFSDNLLYALACDDEAALITSAELVLRLVQHYQLRMALNGFFIRGGITRGPICVTDEIVFGNALIESYLLESKASIVPRVIVARELCEKLRSLSAIAQESFANDYLCQDVDEWWFVNYLDATVQDGHVQWALIQSHKERILQALGGSHRHDVLPKFGWLSRYHNMFCYWHRDTCGYSNEYRIERTDEQSVIHRWSEVRDDA